jgi:hypothetical protein
MLHDCFLCGAQYFGFRHSNDKYLRAGAPIFYPKQIGPHTHLPAIPFRECGTQLNDRTY